VNGGQWLPKLRTFTVFYDPVGSSETNSFDINGTGGSTPVFKLTGGATLNTAATTLFVGHSGNKGAFLVDAGVATFSNVIDVGAGRNATGTVAAEGTLAISNGGSMKANLTAFADNGGRAWGTIGGGSTLTTSSFYVGAGVFNNINASEGTLALASGARVTVTSTALIGYAGGKGFVDISGGTFTANTLDVGYSNAGVPLGNGSISASNGGSISTGNAVVGGFTGIGTVALTGANTRWSNNFSTLVGYAGKSGASFIGIGTGTVSLSNNASFVNTGTLGIGASGRLVLGSGAMLQTGTLDVNAQPANVLWTGGTLKINNGTPIADAAITLNIPNTGTLGGVGNIQRPVIASAGGTLAPGNSVGTISTGALTLESDSTYFVEVDLNGDAADKTQVTGVVNLSGVDNGVGGTLGGAKLEFTLLTGGTPPLPAPRSFILIDNDLADPIAGVFDGLIENTTYARGGVQFSVDYHAGTGNDVAITFTEVPEPAGPLAILGIGSLLIQRRASRRRKHMSTAA
jgi:hypothetical protein